MEWPSLDWRCQHGRPANIDINASVPSVKSAQLHVPSRSLWSSNAQRLAVPQTRMVFASRPFSDAALTVCISLPDSVVNSDILATFKKRLKLTFFAASCEMFLPPSGAAFLIMALYKILSFIHSFKQMADLDNWNRSQTTWLHAAHLAFWHTIADEQKWC